MNRFTRMCAIALLTGVMTAAAVQVSAADGWQRGLGQPTEQQVERSGQVAPGVLRPNLPLGVDGDISEFFGQYYDYDRFFDYFYAYYKIIFGFVN